MKKFMKLLIATALIVTMAVCFAACGGKTMEKVYDLSGVKATAVATQTGRLANFDDQSVATAQGEWVVFSQYNQNEKGEYISTTYTLYNAATEKVVATSTTKNGNPFEIASFYGEYLAVKMSGFVQENNYGGEYTKVSTIYYGETTVDVGAVKDSEIVENDGAELVKIGDYIFKVVDGVVSHVENATASIENINTYMNGYYYDIREDGITVYDASLNLYGFVRVPSYAYARPIVLANGNVLIQYQVEQDPYGDDYDVIFVEDGWAAKTNYETVLYNVEKNTAKEIKFDYVIVDVETENLSEKVDNIAYMYEIKDGRVDYSEEAAIVAKLSNNGKVGTIYGKAEDYLVNAEVEAIAENRFLAKSISKEKVLYNEEMEKLATFTSSANANEQYIVDGNKYYNFDGSLIVDAAEYEIYKSFANGNKVFYKVDADNDQIREYFLLANGACNKIATVKNSVGADDTKSEAISGFGANYYVITSGTKNAETGKWTYTDVVYNMNGAEITSTTTPYVKSAYQYSTVDQGTVITRSFVSEAEGLLVFKVSVMKFNSAEKDGNVIGYETSTEYYYCK